MFIFFNGKICSPSSFGCQNPFCDHLGNVTRDLLSKHLLLLDLPSILFTPICTSVLLILGFCASKETRYCRNEFCRWSRTKTGVSVGWSGTLEARTEGIRHKSSFRGVFLIWRVSWAAVTKEPAGFGSLASVAVASLQVCVYWAFTRHRLQIPLFINRIQLWQHA